MEGRYFASAAEGCLRHKPLLDTHASRDGAPPTRTVPGREMRLGRALSWKKINSCQCGDSYEQPARALFIGALLVGNVSGVAWADGTETLGPPSIGISPGSNFVTAATGMEVQPGTINLNVPAGAAVKQALLYWNCRGTGGGDNTITVTARMWAVT